MLTVPSWLPSWRRGTTTVTDPEGCPSLDESGTTDTKNPKSMSSTTSMPTPSTSTTSTQPMLTRFMAATAVGLHPSALLTSPAWAVPAYSALVQRLQSRLRYFRDTGINIARFLRGSATDLAPQAAGHDGPDVGNGVIDLPHDTRSRSRHRWVWSIIKFMMVVGAVVLVVVMLRRFARLPQSRTFFEELLEIVQRFKANTLT